MKRKRTARQIQNMIKAKMTADVTVGVAGEGDNWAVGVAMWADDKEAEEMNRQAQKIAEELRALYVLIPDNPAIESQLPLRSELKVTDRDGHQFNIRTIGHATQSAPAFDK